MLMGPGRPDSKVIIWIEVERGASVTYLRLLQVSTSAEVDACSQPFAFDLRSEKEGASGLKSNTHRLSSLHRQFFVYG